MHWRTLCAAALLLAMGCGPNAALVTQRTTPTGAATQPAVAATPLPTPAPGNTPRLNQRHAGRMGGPIAVGSTLWADYWDPNILSDHSVIDLKLWVGGPHYETQLIETHVSP